MHIRYFLKIMIIYKWHGFFWYVKNDMSILDVFVLEGNMKYPSVYLHHELYLYLIFVFSSSDCIENLFKKCFLNDTSYENCKVFYFLYSGILSSTWQNSAYLSSFQQYWKSECVQPCLMLSSWIDVGVFSRATSIVFV